MLLRPLFLLVDALAEVKLVMRLMKLIVQQVKHALSEFAQQLVFMSLIVIPQLKAAEELLLML
ncbi:MAG: hypothetical protein CVU81_00515, partial [Euryarchaeota archaeon HGW-Euryarchaeota-1]